MKNKHFWLYVLKCEQGKYYVGITSQTPERRLQEHLGGRKTYWTEKYPPISILDKKDLGNSTEQEAKQIEDLVTRRYMREKGINNVRGGGLTGTSDLVIRFGYVFDELNWQALTTILFLLLIILVLGIELYLK
jgi:predicted GIY-YIG superfamily endonuclease